MEIGEGRAHPRMYLFFLLSFVPPFLFSAVFPRGEAVSFVFPHGRLGALL